ncbi:hypothetical protein Tsp_10166, partial [Trichinella spiralis]|uniref:hypothetical protein n=1 Tax=Trichinella spiralis TaxID=6334 RepID=UPI0001EFDBC2
MLSNIRGSDVKTSETCVTTNEKQSSLYNHFPFPHDIKTLLLYRQSMTSSLLHLKLLRCR